MSPLLLSCHFLHKRERHEEVQMIHLTWPATWDMIQTISSPTARTSYWHSYHSAGLVGPMFPSRLQYQSIDPGPLSTEMLQSAHPCDAFERAVAPHQQLLLSRTSLELLQYRCLLEPVYKWLSSFPTWTNTVWSKSSAFATDLWHVSRL